MADAGGYECPVYNQKLKFAQDLVNYVLQTNALQGILRITALPVENAVLVFGDNFRRATEYVNTLGAGETEQIFNFIMDNNLNNMQWFAHYANTVKEKYFRLEVPYQKGFLRYAVHLAQLAGKLYEQGIRGAPKIAVHYIVDSMEFDLPLHAEDILDLMPDGYVVHQ